LLPPIELPSPAQQLGTAIVVLVDTSGSMAQTVPDSRGRQSPKASTASQALRKILEVTRDWKTAHPETPLYFGLSTFSSSVQPVLPMGPFEFDSANKAVSEIPGPAGGTAIGKALVAAFQGVYATGCVRKHVVCITDGANTVGTPPDLIARQLHAQTHGDVEIHFVAFDTSADQFRFLASTNGTAVEARDETQLQAQLKEIYERRILAEAMPAEKE